MSQCDQSLTRSLIKKIDQLNILFEIAKNFRKQRVCLSSLLWTLSSSELSILLQTYQNRLDYEILKIEGIIEVINRDLSKSLDLVLEQDTLTNDLNASKQTYDESLEIYHQKISDLQSIKEHYQQALIQQMLIIYSIVDTSLSKNGLGNHT